jgi:hypothetical protein
VAAKNFDQAVDDETVGALVAPPPPVLGTGELVAVVVQTV